MEFLMLWLGTCVVSFIGEVKNELRMFKDAADAGYKIDIDKLKQFGENLSPDLMRLQSLALFIPIFNIMQVLKNVNHYNNIRPMVLEQLNVIDALVEMEAFEKEEYLKKPTGFNACLVTVKTMIRIARAATLTFKEEDGEENKIVFEIDKKTKKVNFLSIEGPIAQLNKEQQLEKIFSMAKIVNEKLNGENTDEKSEQIVSDNKEEQKQEETLLDFEQRQVEETKETYVDEENKKTFRGSSFTKKRKK